MAIKTDNRVPCAKYREICSHKNYVQNDDGEKEKNRMRQYSVVLLLVRSAKTIPETPGARSFPRFPRVQYFKSSEAT